MYDVVRIVQTKQIQSRLELMALAAKWQEEGKIDLAEFVANRGLKIVNEAMETAKELNEAQKRLKRANKTRIELLEESAASACVDGCQGEWLSAAREILVLNGIGIQDFSSALHDALKRGRGKYRNVYIYGPANCGKTFLLSPLKKIFECFMNPASGTFAWLGIENAEVVLLNVFRWKPSLIPWCELLQVLEGDTVHFPAPKKCDEQGHCPRERYTVLCNKRCPTCTYQSGSIDRINTEMMQVRWHTFQLHRQIPQNEQKEIKTCNSFFAKLIINNTAH